MLLEPGERGNLVALGHTRNGPRNINVRRNAITQHERITENWLTSAEKGIWNPRKWVKLYNSVLSKAEEMKRCSNMNVHFGFSPLFFDKNECRRDLFSFKKKYRMKYPLLVYIKSWCWEQKYHVLMKFSTIRHMQKSSASLFFIQSLIEVSMVTHRPNSFLDKHFIDFVFIDLQCIAGVKKLLRYNTC